MSFSLKVALLSGLLDSQFPQSVGLVANPFDEDGIPTGITKSEPLPKGALILVANPSDEDDIPTGLTKSEPLPEGALILVANPSDMDDIPTGTTKSEPLPEGALILVANPSDMDDIPTGTTKSEPLPEGAYDSSNEIASAEDDLFGRIHKKYKELEESGQLVPDDDEPPLGSDVEDTPATQTELEEMEHQLKGPRPDDYHENNNEDPLPEKHAESGGSSAGSSQGDGGETDEGEVGFDDFDDEVDFDD